MEGSLNTEDEVLESVKLIFNNARTYNEDDSEWFINANHLEAEFNKIVEKVTFSNFLRDHNVSETQVIQTR